MMPLRRNSHTSKGQFDLKIKVTRLLVVLCFSGCQLIKNQQQPIWHFVTQNNSNQIITDIKIRSLWGYENLHQLHPGSDDNRSVMGSVDPTWYITFQFTTPDGEVHKESFIRLIPWRYWEETALGNREVRFSIKEGGVVVAELSGSRAEEEEKFYREHPEAR